MHSDYPRIKPLTFVLRDFIPELFRNRDGKCRNRRWCFYHQEPIIQAENFFHSDSYYSTAGWAIEFFQELTVGFLNIVVECPFMGRSLALDYIPMTCEVELKIVKSKELEPRRR